MAGSFADIVDAARRRTVGTIPTKAALARIIGVKYKTFDNWHRGRCQPPEWVVKRVSEMMLEEVERDHSQPSGPNRRWADRGQHEADGDN